ncbi:MAG TPA: TetR/AcrR family transcriptional regulator, partial [Acidimicrobiia bacterium]|nr:TetR/AcrR family transcriptional regulator [Acidimicrobiia bacterium]
EPLMPTIRAAVSADPGVADAWRANYGQARYDGTAAGMARLAELGALRPGVDITRGSDIMWTVVSVETYEALVIARGWTPEEYEAWVLDTLRASLLRSRSH